MNSYLIILIRHIVYIITRPFCAYHTKKENKCYMPCRYARDCDLSYKFKDK